MSLSSVSVALLEFYSFASCDLLVSCQKELTCRILKLNATGTALSLPGIVSKISSHKT